MPVLGKTIGYTIRGTRAGVRGGTRLGGWIRRGVRRARIRGGAGEVGMMRLLDLHAASCAGDTLVTMGLAGTIFFGVPAGEARGKVALYLLITMAPFALLAPVVGPMLDRFRHGRRYALAVTMLGRAFLAWLISDYLHAFGLYPAAFGVLALSRAYGVARSAAVPRLLPERLGLSEAGARASVFGTVAGALVVPLGVAAFWVGPQWALRVASVIFLIGMVVALRLPPRADSDPPEVVPRLLWPWRRSAAVLSGRLVVSVVSGGAALRALYGFLALFLAFAIRSGDLTTELFGTRLHQTTALGVVAVALGAGSFLATAVGSRLRIRRPVPLQGIALVLLTALGVVAALRYDLASVALFCLGTAVVSGLAKLAVDATIQERVPETVRASAFAHSETLLMLAWVLGGALGLIPFSGRLGVVIAVAGAGLATLRGILLMGLLRRERLHGAADTSADAAVPRAAPTASQSRGGASTDRARAQRGDPSGRRSRWRGRGPGRQRATGTPAGSAPGNAPMDDPGQDATAHAATRTLIDPDLPGYHLYRPSGAGPAAGGPSASDRDDGGPT